MNIISDKEILVPIWVKPKTKQLFIEKVAYRTISKGSKVFHDQFMNELLNKK